MWRWLCSCLAVLSLALAACGGGGAERDRDRAAQSSGPRLTAGVARALDAKLSEKVEDTGVPGASAAVVFPDGRVWSGAAGVAVLKPERRMTSQSSLPFASITKVATAALAMRLVEQGKLRLDEPIVRRYPAWRGEHQATVRDLLAHSYWYPDGSFDPADVSDGSGLVPSRAEATVASTAGALAGDVPSLARWAHELFNGEVISADSLHEMARFHGGGYWDAYGLGLARSREGDHELWGHGGDGLGNATELWHLPRENVTVAITWNDDLIGSEGGFFPALLRAAIGPN
jgi:CubicO group peptidase (beta-lactamase class C family)